MLCAEDSLLCFNAVPRGKVVQQSSGTSFLFLTRYHLMVSDSPPKETDSRMRFTSGFLLFPYFFFWVSCVCHPSAFLVNEIRDAFSHDFLQPPYACAGVDPVVDERAAGIFHIAAGCCPWFCLCKIISRTNRYLHLSIRRQ